MSKRRLVIGVTGATGSLYAVRMMQMLRERASDVETHLVVSAAGVLNIKHELDIGRHDIYKMADHVHSIRDVGATLASGAFETAGMVIVPCSMRTLAAVAMGLSDNLITRAADVTLKERRRLVMVVRETPFNLAHLRNMTSVTEMGGIIFPPLPAFYHRPKSIEEMVDQTTTRILEMVGVDVGGKKWEGMDAE
mgnify:FL=1